MNMSKFFYARLLNHKNGDDLGRIAIRRDEIKQVTEYFGSCDNGVKSIIRLFDGNTVFINRDYVDVMNDLDGKDK